MNNTKKVVREVTRGFVTILFILCMVMGTGFTAMAWSKLKTPDRPSINRNENPVEITVKEVKHATGYILYLYQKNRSGSVDEVENSDRTFYLNQFSLQEGYVYYFKVKAIDDDGDYLTSNYSSESKYFRYYADDDIVFVDKNANHNTDDRDEDEDRNSNGWTYIGNDTYYYENNRVLKGEQRINGEDYYFDSSGRMIANTWRKVNGRWYFYKYGGQKVKNNWVEDGGKSYFTDHNGVMLANCFLERTGKLYYCGSNGAIYTSKTEQVNCNRCYVSEEEWMKEGNFSGTYVFDWTGAAARNSNYSTPSPGYGPSVGPNQPCYEIREWFTPINQRGETLGWACYLTNGQRATEGMWVTDKAHQYYITKGDVAVQNGYADINGIRYFFDGNCYFQYSEVIPK